MQVKVKINMSLLNLTKLKAYTFTTVIVLEWFCKRLT